MQSQEDSSSSSTASWEKEDSLLGVSKKLLIAYCLWDAVNAGVHTWTFLKQAVQPNHQFGWHLQYLTMVGLVVISVFFAYSFLVHATLILSPRSPKIGTLLLFHRDRYFAVEFALATLISCLFWTLVYPSVSGFPFFDMFMQHGTTGIALWLELVIVPHLYGSILIELGLFIVFGLIYLVWNFLCFHENGEWVYPFQSDIIHPVILAVASYLGLLVVAILAYFLGRFLAYFRWRDHPQIQRLRALYGSAFLTQKEEDQLLIP